MACKTIQAQGSGLKVTPTTTEQHRLTTDHSYHSRIAAEDLEAWPFENGQSSLIQYAKLLSWKESTNDAKDHLERLGDTCCSKHTKLQITAPVKSDLLRQLADSRPSAPITPRPRVCIIGAGISGLYTAYLLDRLCDVHVEYDILEASGRAGGRIQTHRFSDSPTDYAELGAMRFPDLPIMSKTFDLFNDLGVVLDPFNSSKDGCPQLFNGILRIDKQEQQVVLDPFQLGQSAGGLVPDYAIARGADSFMEVACGAYRHLIQNGSKQGLKEMLQRHNCSMRHYLSNVMGLDFHTINWIESTSSATGLFDQAFGEAALDWLVFDTATKWWRIRGGSEELIHNLCYTIRGQISFFKRVVGVKQSIDKAGALVQILGEKEPRQYDAVFCSVPLGPMQWMDLEDCGLSAGQLTAIKSVHYDNSVKVAIRFSNAWWADLCNIKGGGKARTDRPLRTCVYPSNGCVLLCSYTWARDAACIGALATDAELLKHVLLRDLAALHAPTISLQYLRMSYMAHTVMDWSKNPYSAGAFAFFGPGQFSDLYPHLTAPNAGGTLYIVGEAASIQHGWVEGALDSACRAIDDFHNRLVYRKSS